MENIHSDVSKEKSEAKVKRKSTNEGIESWAEHILHLPLP